ncbi:MAG: 3-phosphoshikimate 1-carboxyvinyltransferase [Cyanobacteria bacterium KgW148]|nr:3-phosphoshikimate 1-carboxyvinyltransferase [Cyanobacteria bacterium KgW148]
MIEFLDSSQKLRLSPRSYGVKGKKITVPGDKSISHRALMLGSLAEGETIVRGLLLGEDPRSTAHCFSAMGAEISPLNSELVKIKGIGLGNLQEPSHVLDAGNSGTTLRLMLGILASHTGRFFAITGDESLRARPMMRVVEPLRRMGASIWGRENGAKAPLAVLGQKLHPIHYLSPVASAQVKSAILLAGLLTNGETIVTEPEQSRDHSERMLRAFGANVAVDRDSRTVVLTGGNRLQGQEVIVPGDISSAAFWLVAGSIVPDSEIVIENVGINPTRTGVLEVLAAMGADLTQENPREITGEPVADIRVRSAALKGCEIGGAIIPRLIDEIPVLAVAATCASGRTVIRDAAELRVKESDRIAAMAEGLRALGAEVIEHPDGMVLFGGKPLLGADVDSYNDHRIAMSLAIAGLVAQKQPTTIDRAGCVTISYPSFIPTLQLLYE